MPPLQTHLPPPVPWEPWVAALSVAPSPTPVTADARLVVVSAHPDDETIGAGRLLSLHAGEILAVSLSRGEHCFASSDVDPNDLGFTRLAEWRVAVAELGCRTHESREYWPDGVLGQHVAAISDFLAEIVRPADVLVATWRHDPHPDHVAVGWAAAAVAESRHLQLVEYPVWAPYWMSPEDVRDTGDMLIPVRTSDAASAARERALRHYTSQLEPFRPRWAPVVPAELVLRHPEQLIASAATPRR